MTRRTLLRWAAALAAAWPLASLKVLAVVRRQAVQLTPAHAATLRGVADVVLPSTLSTEDRQLAVTLFLEWTTNYREGAEVGPGYGSPRLRTTGPSPTAAYPAQLAALEAAARATGVSSFSALGLDARRAVIETALTSPQRVTQLPTHPAGVHVVADFMGLFFHGQQGYNLAYRAGINRDECRGLAGSEKAPGGL
ncbi:MAG: hypothetical protein ABIP90_02980 [Vicinamibacterales bacterium]